MEQEKTKPNDNRKNHEESRKAHWDIRPYLAVGLTIILVVVVCIAIFFVILRFQGLAEGIGKALNSIQAIFIGFIVAYLLNPVMKFFERFLRKRLYGGNGAKTPKQKRVIRGLAVTCAMAVFLAVAAILIRLMLPQLIGSVEELLRSMNDMLNSLTDWIGRLLRQDSPLAVWLNSIAKDISEYLQEWLNEKILGGSSWITSVMTGVYNVIRTVFNVVIGLIISVYVLLTKETFIGQLKKIVYAIFRPKYGNMVMEVIHKADDVFGGFFIGKIIDSIIIGFICVACMYILRLPYAVLVSVIVGVTNVIPFFGPYIGAIPSAILIFLTNPVQGLYFIIFIIILQQVDGNIIGPKILGNTTGLSPFWVIFAILLFGGAFGVVGMLFGVPIFAVIYYIVKRIVNHILRIRKLPENTMKYVRLDKVDTQSNTIVEQEEKRSIHQEIRHRFSRKKK